ncbi:F-box protein SKIP31 [Nymphaea colorata]|nr:F-box protein SKIP31 [Nymphaea colorata]
MTDVEKRREEEEDEALAQFLEAEVLSEISEDEEVVERPQKRLCASHVPLLAAGRRPVESEPVLETGSLSTSSVEKGPADRSWRTKYIMSGMFSKIPPELFRHILKFLSSEDLVACALVCRFLNFAASDEFLWRRLYCMRWGLASPTGKPRACAWKKLYIQRDEEDMVEFVRNTPAEFKEYYIQMQVAKRSQAPLPSQVNDDSIILDKTVADQVSIWKSSRGLTDDVAPDHACSGETCTYSQIGDVFICEKTGRVHVCDDTCRETILDPSSGLLVCTISGLCFDSWLSPSEEEPDMDQQQGGATDEQEPFMGSGRFARAYLLGYNCADEKELEAALYFC